MVKIIDGFVPREIKLYSKTQHAISLIAFPFLPYPRHLTIFLGHIEKLEMSPRKRPYSQERQNQKTQNADSSAARSGTIEAKKACIMRRPDDKRRELKIWKQLREFPFNLPEVQATNLHQLGDVLDEAKFKYTHTRKQEIAEQNKLLQAQIDAGGLSTKPLEATFQVILSRKKGRKISGFSSVESKKAKMDDLIPTQNKFAKLSVSGAIDTTDPPEGSSGSVAHPGAPAPQKKFHVPPITIDNCSSTCRRLQN
ncbi:hypothetical protein TNCT_321 [Trichonephila clavata]|uniref:Uncharacterized protein n=1 Tax=Trichonephila clavata TaxID=2740835 RepID=A0A8X6FF35_TRICU|nr:hypothetical protein TNCT_321 [Trichonephila clavata]